MSSGLELVTSSYIMSFRSRRRRRRSPSSSSTSSPSPVIAPAPTFTSYRQHVRHGASDDPSFSSLVTTTAPLDSFERTTRSTLSTTQVSQDNRGSCLVPWSVSTSEPVAVSDLNHPLGTSRSMDMDPDTNPIATVSRVLNEPLEDTSDNNYGLDLTYRGQRPTAGSILAAHISSSQSSSCSTVAHRTTGEQCGPSAETGSLSRFSGSTSFELYQQTLQTEDDDLDCAICLDTIQPRKHAKATLACRHEFHLSCISMAFAMGKEMVCPLCRYLHKDQPFMSLEFEDDDKLSPVSRSILGTSPSLVTHIGPSFHRNRSQQRGDGLNSIPNTQHEHPTSGTVLSMMPSLFETTLGRGPSAGTVQTSPDGICLRTSTWLMLYAMPFTVALCFLGFVLGKVETMWSKISCLIGAAICYMVCWALVVAVMDPDHEARAIVMQRQNQEEQRRQQQQLRQLQLQQTPQYHPATAATSGATGTIAPTAATDIASTTMATAIGTSSSTGVGWTGGWFVRSLRARVVDLADMLEEIPDMMGEWY